MAKTVFSGAHHHLVEVLVAARKASGLTQAEVARRVGKDQSFMSIIEGGQRRVDVLEFVALARAMEADPESLFRSLVANMPTHLSI